MIGDAGVDALVWVPPLRFLGDALVAILTAPEVVQPRGVVQLRLMAPQAIELLAKIGVGPSGLPRARIVAIMDVLALMIERTYRALPTTLATLKVIRTRALLIRNQIIQLLKTMLLRLNAVDVSCSAPGRATGPICNHACSTTSGRPSAAGGGRRGSAS